MKALIPIILCASPAFAGDPTEGERLFQFHCAGCHGPGAVGDGPTSELLTIRPADLTQLAVNAGGRFPTAYVADRIDGTVNIDAHGGPMPMFGLILEGAPEALAVEGGEIIVPRAVADLIAWLASVQVP
ncbi:MAG: c-type cytochrome [Pseudomonadota bacterium]